MTQTLAKLGECFFSAFISTCFLKGHKSFQHHNRVIYAKPKQSRLEATRRLLKCVVMINNNESEHINFQISNSSSFFVVLGIEAKVQFTLGRALR